MQCTGLKDKNGKLIYEGDLVKCNTPYGRNPHKVVYCKERAGLYLSGGFTPNDARNLYLMSGKRMEVIGNIYKNPELLNDNA